MGHRVSNWNIWLIRVAIAAQGKDFEWGHTDCVALTRKCLITILGRDPWKGHIGTWTTQRGALRVYKKSNVNQILEDTGAVKIGKNFATSGDLAVSPNHDMHNLIQIAIILPMHKILISSMADGVQILDAKEFVLDTEFWRYVW